MRRGPDSVAVHWCPQAPRPRRLDGQDLTARLAALGLTIREIRCDLRNLRDRVAVDGGPPALGASGAGRLHQALDWVESATARAAALSERLSRSAGSGSARFPVLSLNAAVRQALHKFGQLAAGIAVRTELDRALWLVRADPSALERLVATLLSRAKAALPEGGTLTLRTENVTRDEKIDGCSPRPMAGEWVCLVAEDSARAAEGGPLHRIFSPVGGPGAAEGEAAMGLAALLGLVRQLGGRLRAHPLPERGASFRIYLPASPGVERRKPDDGPPEDRPGPERPDPAALA